MSAAQKTKLLPIVLAMFHTCFNVCNTGVLIWFIPQLEKVVCKLISLRLIGRMKISVVLYPGWHSRRHLELLVFEAQQEIGSFSERIHRMFGMVRELLETQDSKTFDKLYERIEKYEGISDNMEIEIARYLDQVTMLIWVMILRRRSVRCCVRFLEIESIGDSCFNLARTIKRKGETRRSLLPSRVKTFIRCLSW